MDKQIILYGAGATGGYALKFLQSKGITPVCFVDSNPAKWLGKDNGIVIMSPGRAKDAFPEAVWVATAISRPSGPEIRAEIAKMGVKSMPLWECLDVQHGTPPHEAVATLANICYDLPSKLELYDQVSFRNSPNYGSQMPCAPISEIYFPPFITHRDDEHYVDCGANDGDTIREFRSHWHKYRATTAIEPDQKNREKLVSLMPEFKRPWGNGTDLFSYGVSDFNDASALFASTGDYSAHFDDNPPRGQADRVRITKLDEITQLEVPTYIKMDIEGSELGALWGARRILKEHSPVLAICAYHTSDHLWQIPLLMHAIQPEYKLFLRRYAEGAFEIVWYAVPPERVIDDNERIKEQRRQMHRIAVSDFDCPTE